MKYYACVEEVKDIKNIDKVELRMCPTMETAFAVSIMTNTTNPMAAVADGNGEILTIDPKQQLVKIGWIMRSDFILVEIVDGELSLSSHDAVPYSTNRHMILVHCAGNNYAIANTTDRISLDKIKDEIHPATILNRRVECGVGPFIFKENNKLIFKYLNDKFAIEGSVSDKAFIPDMDSRIIPDGKLLVLNGTVGNATKMKFIGLFSSVIKLYEDVNIQNRVWFYYVPDSSKAFHPVFNPKIKSVDL